MRERLTVRYLESHCVPGGGFPAAKIRVSGVNCMFKAGEIPGRLSRLALADIRIGEDLKYERN